MSTGLHLVSSQGPVLTDCVFVLPTGLGYCGNRAQAEEGTDRSQSLGARAGGFSKLSLQRIVPNNQGEPGGSPEPSAVPDTHLCSAAWAGWAGQKARMGGRCCSIAGTRGFTVLIPSVRAQTRGSGWSPCVQLLGDAR